MTIVYQTDKRSGITYAYESRSYWDKEKKQSRAKRTLAGRMDTTSGKIVPTEGRGRKKKQKEATQIDHTARVKRYFFGATYLFD